MRTPCGDLRLIWLLILTLGVAAPVHGAGEDRESETAIETAGVADSAGVLEVDLEPEPPPYCPHALFTSLGSFRLGRSADVEEVALGDASDPMSPAGVSTLGDLLRLSAETRLRQLSWGPTAESLSLQGVGSGSAGLLLGGTSLGVPGTSAPHVHEVFLSEVASYAIVPGGTGALFGPDAAGGAVYVEPRFPAHDRMLSRAVGEEGVDGYQRASFQVARPLGPDGAFTLTTESRRIDGFFDGTREVDRQFDGQISHRWSDAFEGSVNYRVYDGDGTTGGTDGTPVRSLTTGRSDLTARLLHARNPEAGTLLEIRLLRERLSHLGGDTPLTREIVAPTLRTTADLPAWLGLTWVARAEATRWRIEAEEAGTVDCFWRAGAAVRSTAQFGGEGFVTGTARADVEQNRRRALHARVEGEWPWRGLVAFAVGSRSERIPDRGAEGSANEVHWGARVGLRTRGPTLVARANAFGTRIHDLRPEPSFSAVRSREPVLAAPLGTGRIGGGSIGLNTDVLRLPLLRTLGDLMLRTSFTWLSAELEETDERLPRRPRQTWTGEGSLSRRFFHDDLLFRVRGRLTHYGDRVNEQGAPVADAWINDVILEAEIADAVFFYRFQDLLERADEIEPGIRLPGFSHMFGLSWRFWD